MIRIEQVWLSKAPLDMRAGPETCLARVVQRFGAAKPQCAYVFLNKRANRMKVLVHDGFGLWLAANIHPHDRIAKRLLVPTDRHHRGAGCRQPDANDLAAGSRKLLDAVSGRGRHPFHPLIGILFSPSDPGNLEFKSVICLSNQIAL